MASRCSSPTPSHPSRSASERRGNTLERLNATAIIWPCPSYMCRIRLTAMLPKELKGVLIVHAVESFEVRAYTLLDLTHPQNFIS